MPDLFELLAKPIFAYARELAETLPKEFEKFKAIHEEKLEPMLKHPATEFLYRALGLDAPRGKEDLTLVDARGLPHYRFSNRPQTFDLLLNEAGYGEKFYFKLHTSGTVRQKKVIIPGHRLLDRAVAAIHAYRLHGIPLEGIKAAALVYRNAPSFFVANALRFVFDPPGIVYTIQDLKEKGVPEELNDVDILVTTPSYLEIALKYGLKLKEGMYLIYTSEPMPIHLRKQLEELGVKIVAYYGSAEMRFIGLGPEGKLSIMPTYYRLNFSYAKDDHWETLDVRSYVQEKKFEDAEAAYVRPFFTTVNYPLLLNVDIGDLVHINGVDEYGYPTTDYITRADKIIEAYPIPPFGKAKVIITPYLRSGILFMPLPALRRIMDKLGAKFLALMYPNKGLILITDKPVDRDMFFSLMNMEVGYTAWDSVKELGIEIRFVTCPEALEAYYKTDEKKRYDGLIVIERKEFDEKAPCADQVVFTRT